MDALRYKVIDYPKGDNSNYILGNYLKQTIIEKEVYDDKG